MSYDNIEYWQNWYFIGLTKDPLDEIEYELETIQTILSAAQIQIAIAGTGAAKLENLINRKGTTVWHILYVYSMINDKQGLEFVSQSKSQMFVPKSVYKHSEVNWPAEILNKYKIRSKEWEPFIIPFIIYNTLPRPKQLESVLSSKDGNRKLVGVFEFNEENPEEILRVAEHYINAAQNN